MTHWREGEVCVGSEKQVRTLGTYSSGPCSLLH